MNNLLQIAYWFILIYATLTALGGIMGYMKAKSKVSLIMGLVSGTVLFAAWWICGQTPVLGLGLAASIALFLLIVFVNRYIRTRALMPAGLMTILSACTTVLFSVAWLSSSGNL